MIAPVAKVLEVRDGETHRRAEAQNPLVAMNVWVRSATDSRVFFLPSRFAPARTPSVRDGEERREISHEIYHIQGGSVTMASNKPPIRQGC